MFSAWSCATQRHRKKKARCALLGANQTLEASNSSSLTQSWMQHFQGPDSLKKFNF
jgi:hypothetical protein